MPRFRHIKHSSKVVSNISKKVHSIVEMVQFVFKNKNQKIIQIEFDMGSLKKIDILIICETCNLKSEFLKFRIYKK